jgi:hypothetical protein
MEMVPQYYDIPTQERSEDEVAALRQVRGGVCVGVFITAHVEERTLTHKRQEARLSIIFQWQLPTQERMGLRRPDR